MRPFLSSLAFLTIFPVSKRYLGNEGDLAKGTIFFPIIGLLIGLATTAVSYPLYLLFPHQLAALMAIGLLMGFSGALHIDGFADTCDGFLSSRPRQEVLSIMRDSRVGTMAVIGIVWLVLCKWISFSQVPSAERWMVLILMPLTGRTAILIMMALLPYARVEGGLATAFAGVKGRKWTGAAIGFALMLIFSIVGFGLYGIAISVISAAGILLFCSLCYRRIGGYTGDTLGAVCEISELFPPLLALLFVCTGGKGL